MQRYSHILIKGNFKFGQIIIPAAKMAGRVGFGRIFNRNIEKNSKNYFPKKVMILAEATLDSVNSNLFKT